MHNTKEKYLVDNPDFPYCGGCGHTLINKQVAKAFERLNLKASKINLVSDIGCVGLVDKMFVTNTIHTTHGRSTAFACGLQIADQVLFEGDATHVIMIGDGGATIGLLHLVEAAKMNANVTVILHNNFVYGMTGGQNSGLTPANFRTATTMQGSLLPNIHIVKLLEACQAGFLARKLATDKDLDEVIAQAIAYKGFSLVEIVELCTGYASKWNSLTKKDIETILENSDSEKRGILTERADREDFGALYARNFPKHKQEPKYKIIKAEKNTKENFSLDIVISGSAGEGVQFAGKNLAESSLKMGLNIMQKNDNPITIGTGFSIAELKISTEEIYYSGIESPDYILISSLDGLKRAKEFLDKANPDKTTIIIDSNLELQSNCKIHRMNFREQCKNDPRQINIMLLDFLKNIETKLSPPA